MNGHVGWTSLVGCASRRSPLGRGTLARYLHHHAPSQPITYTDHCGFRRTSDLNDWMEAQLFAGVRDLQPEVLAAIRPGDWVIDVGANVGLVTGEVCRAVGAAGAIWAIEPLPRNVAQLTQLKNSNELKQLTVFPVACGSESGTAKLSLPRDGNSGHASFTATWIDGGFVNVKTERLDDLVAKHAPDKPLTFLKLDVEGFEQEVLAGAANTIARHQPAILCEFNDIILRDRNSSNRELLSAFGDLGYQPVGDTLPRDEMVADVLLHHR